MAPAHDIDTAQQVSPKATPSINPAILEWFSGQSRGKVPDMEVVYTDLTLHPKVILGGNNLIVIVRKGNGENPLADPKTPMEPAE